MKLIERYIAEVGRHLPQKNKEDIQTEIGSTIEDMLDDHFGDAHRLGQLAYLGLVQVPQRIQGTGARLREGRSDRGRQPVEEPVRRRHEQPGSGAGGQRVGQQGRRGDRSEGIRGRHGDIDAGIA